MHPNMGTGDQPSVNPRRPGRAGRPEDNVIPGLYLTIVRATVDP